MEKTVIYDERKFLGMNMTVSWRELPGSCRARSQVWRLARALPCDQKL
jgi:hypothetical protein